MPSVVDDLPHPMKTPTTTTQPSVLPSRFALGLSLALASLPLATMPVRGAAVPCGSTIVNDLTLDQDMDCAGNALVVGVDGIRINLNGHTIRGTGAGRGIDMNGRTNVTVQGGTIRNFETGIFVANSTRVTIRGSMFTQNREGVFLNGSTDCIVEGNTSWQNLIRGIMVRPSATRTSMRNEIKENSVSDNPVGILLFGQPGNIFSKNRVSGSSQAGIFLTGDAGNSGNQFTANSITNNAVGIHFAVTGWVGNTFVDNTVASNNCGVKGPTSGNVLQGNVSQGNVSDACPANADFESRLINLSARTLVGTGENTPVTGFYFGGSTAKLVLVRAIGPTWATFGVAGALSDSRVDVFQRGVATAVSSNDNWGGTAALRSAFESVGAFSLPEASRDAALIVTLQPGAYTVQVSGVGGATGVALVEVYELTQ